MKPNKTKTKLSETKLNYMASSQRETCLYGIMQK